MEKTRTLKQNAALHLMFTQLAQELNEAGFDMKKTLKPEIEIMWNDLWLKSISGDRYKRLSWASKARQN
jgi:hypothetical protein